MTLNIPRVRQYLAAFDFETLFIEELGWDRHAADLELTVSGQRYPLHAFAEKRGVQVFECRAETAAKMPDFKSQRKIETQLRRAAREHLVIYTDAAKTKQVWKPVEFRGHEFYPGHQSGDSLIEKLQSIQIPLDEEEALDLLGAVHKIRDAFDRDRITKRFYDYFQKEQKAFLGFIAGIQAEADRQWYASLMLNRLMFVYFIQRKGFLDRDKDYLRNRLRMVQLRKGKGKFHTFYRYFLLALFHQGFSTQPDERELDADLQDLLGDVPYVNGGLFDVHELERDNPKIDIPDEAFERIFGFFDQYEWTLDTRPLHSDKEINPDVLGYIFEKYINQKQMGAYYTKEDITDYISRNTIIPYLFDEARKNCAVAFQPGSALWRLLQETPDRYIYPAVRKGVIDDKGEIVSTPAEIEQGIEEVAKRDGWNRPAGAEYALPTETWREYAARRQRCLEVRQRLAGGGIAQVNDLITYNLDIRRFAEDAILSSEGPELLRAFYHAITGITVLDPTCGSGAFLFAALNILEPLYEACLDRMRTFVEELAAGSPRPYSGEGQGVRAMRHSPKKFEDFRAVLEEVARHPNPTYFVLKSIIVKNLYGVDIMEEAVEICKLRLFLKLVSQVDQVRQLEPLPDIDFNIRPGNTLVGFATLDDVRRTVLAKLADKELKAQVSRVVEDAEIVDRAFQEFHKMQTVHGMNAGEFAAQKRELRERLDALDDQLDHYLAGEYAISADKKDIEMWQTSHQPFHWFAEFFGIMRRGGFSVIIGNPPYVEYSKVRRAYRINGYESEASGNLYAFCIERSFSVLARGSRFGFIVQAPIVSTQRMSHVRKLLRAQSDFLAVSTYDDRPSKLFDGMHHCRLAIVIARKGSGDDLRFIETTRYNKWYKEERSHVFETLQYLTLAAEQACDILPKFRSPTELAIYSKLQSMRNTIGEMMSNASRAKYHIYYKITGVGHWFAFTLEAPKFWRDGGQGSSTRENTADFEKKLLRDTAFCCLCSSLHYWVYQARTNCRDFNPSDLQYLPVPQSVLGGLPEFGSLATDIMRRLEETSDEGSGTYSVGGSVRYQKFKPRTAKEYFDQVDALLAQHYGFTDEELDFILNYDIKYRLGQDDEEEDE